MVELQLDFDDEASLNFRFLPSSMTSLSESDLLDRPDSEFCSISNVGDGLKYRVRHFTETFEGWEENQELL